MERNLTFNKRLTKSSEVEEHVKKNKTKQILFVFPKVHNAQYYLSNIIIFTYSQTRQLHLPQ